MKNRNSRVLKKHFTTHFVCKLMKEESFGEDCFGIKQNNGNNSGKKIVGKLKRNARRKCCNCKLKYKINKVIMKPSPHRKIVFFWWKSLLHLTLARCQQANNEKNAAKSVFVFLFYNLAKRTRYVNNNYNIN